LILSLVPHRSEIYTRYLRRHPFHGIIASIANLTCLLGSTEVQSSRPLDDARSRSFQACTRLRRKNSTMTVRICKSSIRESNSCSRSLQTPKSRGYQYPCRCSCRDYTRMQTYLGYARNAVLPVVLACRRSLGSETR
jgi:hypothetical protein